MKTWNISKISLSLFSTLSQNYMRFNKSFQNLSFLGESRNARFSYIWYSQSFLVWREHLNTHICMRRMEDDERRREKFPFTRRACGEGGKVLKKKKHIRKSDEIRWGRKRKFFALRTTTNECERWSLSSLSGKTCFVSIRIFYPAWKNHVIQFDESLTEPERERGRVEIEVMIKLKTELRLKSVELILSAFLRISHCEREAEVNRNSKNNWRKTFTAKIPVNSI